MPSATPSAKGSALVTGGAGGIGTEIARRLVADGFRVVITDVDREAGARVRDELQVEFIPGDSTSEADMRRAMDSAGPVEVLVNNVGIREVAAAVSYMANEDAVGITGTFLDVSGGFE
ncbi:MAG TPA: SDR family NAD(P)-dependent oxidoreductase [Streptosporangiaceae bacterium]|jgi:NAD(P)-dependent dehydrogenase (short-subunit alcohol dehydrogenase family)|nr:SDR family NAD(P)-dependent oxidoreductase [Streptosporangiaceae bacterium]